MTTNLKKKLFSNFVFILKMGSCSSTDSNINEKTNVLTIHDIISVRDSWRSVVHLGLVEFGTEFMVRLLIRYPNLSHLWTFAEGLDSEEKLRENTRLIIHGEKLFIGIESIIYTLDDMDTCTKLLIKLGYTHYKRGVREEHFQVY